MAVVHLKQLQLLQELSPGITRVALLGPRAALEQYRRVPPTDGVTMVAVKVEDGEQFEESLATVLRERADAQIAVGSPVAYVHGRRIVAFAAETKLPTMYAYREAVEAGGLISYGSSTLGRFRQAAKLVDRILKGARPEDLPTEQPITFELVINLKTAKALGLTVPPTLLARADEVIE
jgi:putative ABC transport system substrate-binding protein